jgi:hypothetical protein
MATSIDDDGDENEERAPFSANATTPLDERIIAVIRRTRKDDENGHRTIKPATLVSELGLSIEEATRELCGLLSAVGGGEDGASFKFERVEMPVEDNYGGEEETVVGSLDVVTMTMVFTFPIDFEERVTRYRRHSDYKRRLCVLIKGITKMTKIVVAFGLIISLAILIIAAICLLVAAIVAISRGGGGGGNGGRGNLIRKIRFLFFELRQVLWLYAICGSTTTDAYGRQDPWLREVAGDLAMFLSVCANPGHPFFWMRLANGGMRQRWQRVGRSRGWGGNTQSDMHIDGIAMIRRGTWGQDDDGSSSSNAEQQRGLLSIAVEFLFGPSNTDDTGSSSELDKWKFRAAVILMLSSKSPGSGISLRDLLSYVDNPPSSVEDPTSIRETLKVVTYFNGKPYQCGGDQCSGNNMDARFCFPELVAEFDCQALLALCSSIFVPPVSLDDTGKFVSILYKEEIEIDIGSTNDTFSVTPAWLYEQPFVLTELTQQQFGQCVLLGLLNLVGILWVRNATKQGGLFELPITGRDGTLVSIASLLVSKLLNILRFYAGFFLALPLFRLVIVLIRNYNCKVRNERRRSFVTAE